MNEDVNQPEQASTAGADSPNEFAVYGYEETPVPYLPLPSASPQQLAELARPAPIADAPQYQKQEGNQGKGAQDRHKKRRRLLSLSSLIIVFAISGSFYGVHLVLNTQLLRSGVAVQGIIVEERSACGGRISEGKVFSVLFTDRTGQTHTGTFDQCSSYSDFHAAPGDSVTIVYLPDNPTLIAPRDDLPSAYQFDLVLTVLLFTLLIVVIGLPLGPWLGRLIRKRRGAYATYPSTNDESPLSPTDNE